MMMNPGKDDQLTELFDASWGPPNAENRTKVFGVLKVFGDTKTSATSSLQRALHWALQKPNMLYFRLQPEQIHAFDNF